jgi:hypothetical protein
MLEARRTKSLRRSSELAKVTTKLHRGRSNDLKLMTRPEPEEGLAT